MLLQLRPARLHLDEHTLGPEQVGEFLAATGARGLAFEEFELRAALLLRDAKLEGRAGLDDARMAERAKEALEKRLRLALLIAFQRTGEGDELREGGFKFCGGHGPG